MKPLATRIAPALAILLLAAGAAQAAIITQTVTVAPHNTFIGHSSTSPGTAATQSFAFNKFDITAGTLTNVSFTYTFSISDTMSGGPGGGGAGLSGTIGFNGTAETNPANSQLFNASAVGSGSVSGSTTYTATASSTISFTEPVSVYQGTGTYTFDWLANNIYSGSNAFVDSINLTNASVTATYTYTPVPEPATGLFGLGALVVLSLRRRAVVS